MRFLVVFLLALLAYSATFIAVVRLIDPRGDFHTGLFPVLLSDARKTKQEQFVVFLRQGNVKGIVLGSSRSMNLEPRLLQARFGNRFFNFAVDSARTEDYLAVYRWVRQQGAQPTTVVVGLDIESLHNDDLMDSRLQMNMALRSALAGRPLGTRDNLIYWGRKYKTLFSDSYARDVVGSVWLAVTKPAPETRALLLEADGYLRYPRWESERSSGTFNLEREIAECLPTYAKRFEGMTSLSSRRRQYLEQLVEDATADGATVIVWITSLHPKTVQYLEKRTKYQELHKEVADRLEELRNRYRVAVHDYSDPGAYGGIAGGWYDCGHIDERNAALVVAGLARNAS